MAAATAAVLGYDIVVVAGEVNAVGAAATGQTPLGPTNIFMLPANGAAAPVKAAEPLSHDNAVLGVGTPKVLSAGAQWTWAGGAPADWTFGSAGTSTFNHGSALWFANAYVNNGFLGTGRRLLLVQTSVAGFGFTGSAAQNWWAPAGAAYADMTVRVAAALGKTFTGASASGNRVVALLFSGGEMDASLGCTAVAYKAALAVFWTSAKAAWNRALAGSANGALMLVHGLAPNVIQGAATSLRGVAITLAHAQAVSGAQKDVGGSVFGAPIPSTVYVPSEGQGINCTNVASPALTPAGYNLMGQSAITAYALALNPKTSIFVSSFLRTSANTPLLTDASIAARALTVVGAGAATQVTVVNDYVGPRQASHSVLKISATRAYPAVGVSVSKFFPSGSFTKCAWVKFADVNSGASHIFSGNASADGASGVSHLLWVPTGGKVRAGFSATTAGTWATHAANAAAALTLNTWHHVACVYTLNQSQWTLTLYVDDSVVGTYAGADANPGIYYNDNTHNLAPQIDTMFLGMWHAGGSTAAQGFNGWLYDVRLYAAALTQTDIKGIYSLA